MNWKRGSRYLLLINMTLLIAFGGFRLYKGQQIVKQDKAPAEVKLAIENKVTEIKPKIALTFDDGPHPVFTPELLEGLKERDVKATFFVVGKNVVGNEAIVEQMNKDGHLIGNHTYDHVEINKISDTAACDQILRTSNLICEITGEHTEFIRPPFGLWKKNLECGISMIPVLWTIDPLDWTTSNVSRVVNKVVTKVKENDIILLHDYYDSSVKAALQIIDQLEAKGYEFVTVDKLILE